MMTKMRPGVFKNKCNQTSSVERKNERSCFCTVILQLNIYFIMIDCR